MLNVGCNQVIMVEEGSYRTIQEEGTGRERAKAAMREVIAVARAEGVHLGKKIWKDIWLSQIPWTQMECRP